MNRPNKYIVILLIGVLSIIIVESVIIARVIVDRVLSQESCAHTSVERNSQGQRLDFDRCATILQWTEECSP